MKHIAFLIILLISVTPKTIAQKITVTMNGTKVVLPAKATDFSYSLPVSLVFDKAFKNKKITFYSEASEAKILTSAFFDSDIGHQPDASYAIEIDLKGTIGVLDKTKSILDKQFYIKIDNSDYSDAIRIDKGANKGPAANVVIINSAYIGGFVLNDALKLNQIINDTNQTSLTEQILKDYGITNKKTLLENKFLSKVLPVDQLFTGGIQGKQEDGGGVQGAADLFSSIGGLDVTTIADGIAKFLVKRTKEELSITFFQKFKDDLHNNQDLQAVFPNTYNLLEAIDQQIYNYSNYISNLREAFRSDLSTLDEHLPGLIDNHRDVFAKPGNFQLGVALRTGCYVSSSLKHQMHPGDILENYPVSYLTEGAPKEDAATLNALRGAIQLLQLVSESLKENGQAYFWVKLDKIRACVSNKISLEIYFGLLLQVAHSKYKDIQFGNGSSFYGSLNTDDVVNAFDSDYSQYRQYILTLGSKLAELEDMGTSIKGITSDSLKIEKYASYVKAYSGFLNSCVQASQLPLLNKVSVLKDLEGNSKNYFEIIDETSDLVIAINRKRYSEAINHLVVIYNVVVNKPITATPEKIVPKITADTAKIKDVPPAANADAKISGEALVSLTRYGAFMASIVVAQKSDDVAAAIEAVALPVGSASIKKHSLINVSLNAYVGAFGGYEQIKGVDQGQNQISFKNWNSYGIAAPIGIAFSRSLFRKWKNPFSASVMVSIIDIGALVAYRFNSKNDSVSSVPTIKLQNIISPGVFVSLGFPNVPVSLNAGYQLGPALRSVRGTANSTSNSYTRFSLSLCMDIPLLNLYTKTK